MSPMASNDSMVGSVEEAAGSSLPLCSPALSCSTAPFAGAVGNSANSAALHVGFARLYAAVFETFLRVAMIRMHSPFHLRIFVSVGVLQPLTALPKQPRILPALLTELDLSQQYCFTLFRHLSAIQVVRQRQRRLVSGKELAVVCEAQLRRCVGPVE